MSTASSVSDCVSAMNRQVPTWLAVWQGQDVSMNAASPAKDVHHKTNNSKMLTNQDKTLFVFAMNRQVPICPAMWQGQDVMLDAGSYMQDVHLKANNSKQLTYQNNSKLMTYNNTQYKRYIYIQTLNPQTIAPLPRPWLHGMFDVQAE